MAGNVLKKDPAIEKWVEMRHDLYKNFRWTGKSTRQAAFWGIAVPIVFYYLSTSVEGKFSFRGKGRDDPITQK